MLNVNNNSFEDSDPSTGESSERKNSYDNPYYTIPTKDDSLEPMTPEKRESIIGSYTRSYNKGMERLSELSVKLDIPDTLNNLVRDMYLYAIDHKLARGRSINTLVAACVYATFRCTDFPRTLDEIAQAHAVNRSELGGYYRLLLRHFNLNVSVASPLNYVDYLFSRLDLSQEMRDKTTEILALVTKNNLFTGKDPAGVIAACVYIASLYGKQNITQRRIADAANVTEVTVRSRYKEFVKKLNLDYPQVKRGRKKRKS